MTVFFYMSKCIGVSIWHALACSINEQGILFIATSSTQLLNGSTVVKVCGCHRWVVCMVIPGGSMRNCYKASVRGRLRDAPCATVGLKVGHVDEAPCVSMCKKRRGICT